ncbi:hypothetical protein ACPRNU_09250 [Chromobacterium vaccinii]|uniref:hypothetical protein n=1 Tax=Chromobacterium vaccinii TaxID=1108595 RepID=UPI003C72362C
MVNGVPGASELRLSGLTAERPATERTVLGAGLRTVGMAAGGASAREATERGGADGFQACLAQLRAELDAAAGMLRQMGGDGRLAPAERREASGLADKLGVLGGRMESAANPLSLAVNIAGARGE